MHPTEGHRAWFPVRAGPYALQVYTNISEAVAHLTEFAALLRGAGIRVNFVRLPGGLISELMAYLQAQSVPATARRDLANRIIQEEDISSVDPRAVPVQRDYRLLMGALGSLSLHLWGGGSGAQMVSAQSWEAESSGSGLTDDVTTTFRRRVDEFSTVHRPRSLVVLAHDINTANAAEVGRDIAEMESYALRNGVRVEYYTMSNLIRIVRGAEP